MVVHGFSHQCHLTHESPRTDEISELAAAFQLAIDQLPVGERLVKVVQFVCAEQGGGHGRGPGGSSVVGVERT